MTNWRRLRSFFPVSDRAVYLDHAGRGPISSRVDESLREWSDRQLHAGALDAEREAFEVARVRSRIADLLGVASHAITLTRSASEALGLVATGLRWRPSDVVLSLEGAHPDTLYPWLALARFGVTVERLRAHPEGLDLDELGRRLESPRVQLVCLASVDYRTGLRIDLSAVGALCREHGVLLCVDASQSLGCLPLAPERLGIDFLAAVGHKWLLAGPGTGFLYVAAPVSERVQPRVVGWHSVEEPEALEREQRAQRQSGARLEPGGPDPAASCRLGAAIDLTLEIGIDAIAKRVQALRQRIDAGLDARGLERVSPGDERASGIAAFRPRRETATETVKRLAARSIHVGGRGDLVRVSPHFYNDETEIERFLAAL